MCGWLAAIATTSPSSRTRRTAVVVEVADRVPEQVAAGRADEVGLLADADARLDGDAEQVGFELAHPRPVTGCGQLVERRPLLPLGRHPLALVGADGTHLDALGVLDPAGLTDPHARSPLASRRPSARRAYRYSRSSMASLVLGPLLRYVGSTQATVWVETDAPCEVTVLGHRERTFHVEGHHYALVVIDGSRAGIGDAVRGAPRRRAGLAESTASARRAPSTRGTTSARHGWCSGRAASARRSASPTRSPRTSTRRRSRSTPSGRSRGGCRRAGSRGPTACCCWATRCTPTRSRPRRVGFIRGRRDVSEPPGEEVADFEEYTRLYRESWSDPDIRWLLSTVPSTMIFDDHDVHDDWNISGCLGAGDASAAVVGRSGSSAPSWRTGSTSTSATSRRPSSRRTA